MHWHADVPPDSPDWRLRTFYRAYRPFEQATLARARVIVATSRPYLEASAALSPWKDKARVIPLGIGDLPAFSTPAQPPAWPASGLRLLAVGRLSRYKGFGILLEALAQVADASLLLVGHGECERELRALASARGLDARLHLAGDLDDDSLAAAYAAADAFVLPSLDRGEAFGLVLLEAMRAGLPVIASAIPGSGVGSVVVDGETGLLVTPGDVAGLAAAIERMRNPDLRHRLGQAGERRWRENFALEATMPAWRRIYTEAVRATPA